jgi:hypothetical protein
MSLLLCLPLLLLRAAGRRHSAVGWALIVATATTSPLATVAAATATPAPATALPTAGTAIARGTLLLLVLVLVLLRIAVITTAAWPSISVLRLQPAHLCRLLSCLAPHELPLLLLRHGAAARKGSARCRRLRRSRGALLQAQLCNTSLDRLHRHVLAEGHERLLRRRLRPQRLLMLRLLLLSR